MLAATHEVVNQPYALADYNLFDGDAALKEAVAREGAAWAARLAVRARRKARDCRDDRTRRARQSPSARIRHPRPLWPARRSRALSSRLSRADAARDRARLARLAVDEPRRGRACRARRGLLYAERGRGGPRLPDHHDVRRDAGAAARARRRRGLAAEGSLPRLRPAQHPRRPEDRARRSAWR